MVFVIFLVSFAILGLVYDAHAHYKAVARIPPLPGVVQNGAKPKIILAQDINYPPFAFLGAPTDDNFDLAGIVIDVVEGLNEVCDIEIVTV